jgi:hypothetical protein
LILKDSKGLEMLEKLLDDESIKPSTNSTCLNVINLEFYGSENQEKQLKAELEKIHLKFQRGTDYYNSNSSNREHKYEIRACDGEGKDIITTYCYSHSPLQI